jgi:excisionase family DNA binding protein
MQVEVWYYNVTEVARRLGCHRTTVLARIRRGDLPHIKVANFYRVPVEALGDTPPTPLVSPCWRQLELPFDPPLRPVRVWRNTGRPIVSQDADSRFR